MNDLFEGFFAKSLAEQLPTHLRVDAQVQTHLDRRSLVRIIPDLVLTKGPIPVAVLDTKYKRLDGGDFVNHDIYQVLAYCTALQLEKGMLIYPEHLVSFGQETLIRNSEIAIQQVTMSLTGGIADLQLATSDLAAKVAAWADAGNS
jgi:5-methylcytosine-specific restriction enzyme subunit McrC